MARSVGAAVVAIGQLQLQQHQSCPNWVTSFTAAEVFDDSGKYRNLEDTGVLGGTHGGIGGGDRNTESTRQAVNRTRGERGVWERGGDELKAYKDLVGTEKSVDECQEFVDYWYLKDRDATVFPVKDGEWAMTRDTENKGRGDRGSVKSRRDSVARSGVLCTRGGPFLYEDRLEKNVGKYDVGHWATLFEGMKQLWLEDPEHPSLQRSLTVGIPHAKIYNRNTPSFARKWIKDLGNAEADVVTLTTPIEVWGCTEETEAAFIAHKDELNLTVKSVGSQALWEEEKFKIASRLYPGRWQNKTLYIRSVAFLKEACELPITLGPYAGQSLWQAVEDAFMKHGDFSDPAAQKNMKNLINNADTLVRCLKKEEPWGPEAIVDILLLMVPSPKESKLGKCSLLPQGLPLLDFAFSDDDVKELLRPLRETQTFSSMREGGKLTVRRQHVLAKKQEKRTAKASVKKARADARAAAKAAAADARKPRTASAAAKVRHALKEKLRARQAEAKAKSSSKRVAQQAALDEEIEALAEQDGDVSWLCHLKQTEEYLLKVAPNQADKVRAMRLAALRAALAGHATVHVGGMPRVLKSWLKMRLTFKASIYKASRLQVRPSDCDAAADFMDNEWGATDGPAGVGGADGIVDPTHLKMRFESAEMVKAKADFVSFRIWEHCNPL